MSSIYCKALLLYLQSNTTAKFAPRATPLPFTRNLFPNVSALRLTTRKTVRDGLRFPFQAMVSLPGSLRSLKVCMLITSSVFTIMGRWGLCLSRRWHLRETRSSSTMALQKDLCKRRRKKKAKWVSEHLSYPNVMVKRTRLFSLWATSFVASSNHQTPSHPKVVINGKWSVLLSP